MDYAENAREHDMEELATATQNTLANALSKLEEAIFDTNTNRCRQMEPLYNLFEQRILDELVNVGFKSL